MSIYLKLFLFSFLSTWISLGTNVTVESDDTNLTCWRPWCSKILKKDFNSFYNETAKTCIRQNFLYKEFSIKQYRKKKIKTARKLKALRRCCRCSSRKLLMESIKKIDGEKREKDEEWNRGLPGISIKSKQWKQQPSIKTHSPYLHYVISDNYNYGANESSYRKRIKRSIQLNQNDEPPTTNENARKRPRKQSLVPMFENRTYHVTINENSPPATAVLLLQATMVDSRMKMRTVSANDDYKHSSHGNDADASTEDDDGRDDKGDVIRYRLENDEYDSFAIDSKTGLITVKDPRKLDFEATSRLKVMVIAEAGMSCDFVTLWIHLRDVNDNSPQFARDKYVSAVYEGLPAGSYVTQISAEDKDSGQNSRLSYYIISGNTNHAFTINPSNTGIIKTDAILDREERDFYRLEVEVRDQGSVQKSGRAVLRIQIVDVNDNKPKFQDVKDVAVSEASELNSIIIQLMASDVDLNTTFAFSIVNQTNHPPSDWLSFKTDSTNKMSTSLSQGLDRLNHDPYFDVEKSSGKIRIIRKLDRELYNKHVLIVEVSDGSLNSIGSLNVFVSDANDNPPLFNLTNYEISVLELTKADSLVSSIVAHDDDVDENSLIAYELIGSDLFRIDKNTGNIYTNQNVTLRKGQGSHVIDAVVKATDRGTPPLSSVVPVRFTLVDVNNYPPIFTSESYSLEVPEDEKIDARPLLKLSSSDDDLDESNTRTFYDICGSSEKDGSYFRLDSTTGELFLSRSLDREAKDSHRLLVKVSNSLEGDDDDDDDGDDGCLGHLEELRRKNGRKKNEVESSLNSHPPSKSLNSTLHSFAIVNIKVLDVNDNAPKFAEDVYRATLSEDSSIDAPVLRLTTSDEDFDQKVVYSIIGGNEDNMFLLNPATGLLSLRMKLDYETRNQYILSIEAKDTGWPSLSSHCSVEIGIIDSNEFRPIFSNILYIGSLQEGSPLDTLVFTVRATDRDAGLYGMVHYKLVRLTEHSDPPDLQINPVTGQVRMRSAVTLPSDGHSTFNYLVVAEDAGGLNATVSAVVTVEPMSSAKRKLRFENASYHFQLPGNSAAGSVVGRVSVVKNSARDDVGGYVFIQYHFLHENDLFAINSTSGEIFLQVDLKLVSLSEGLSHLLEDSRDYDDEDVRKRKDKRHFQFNGVVQSFDERSRSKARRQNKLMKRSAIITSSHLETVQLTVVAEWNSPDKERATTDLKIDVDRSCDGCSLEPLVGRVKDGSLSRSHTVTLVAFFLGIFFVMAAVAVVMVMRHRKCRKPKKSGVVSMESDHATNRCSSINTTLAIPSPPPFLNGRTCRVSNHFSPLHPSPVLSTSRTDEEVRLINNNRFTPPPNHPSVNEKCSLVKSVDDDDATNVVHRDRCCDVNESFSHDDYHTTSPQVECTKPRVENETLKLLGNMEELFLAGKLPLSPSSMESIHLFSEEGGGESGWIGTSNMKNDVQSHFASGNSKIKPKDYFLPKWLLNVETNNNNNDDDLNINEASRNPSSQDRPLPSGVFRLVECLPDYHSLSDVYDEIAKLRDQKSVPTPKMKPTKIVVSVGDDQGIEKLSRFYPPPILTDVPPPCWVHQRETWAGALAPPLKGHV